MKTKRHAGYYMPGVPPSVFIEEVVQTSRRLFLFTLIVIVFTLL